MHIYIVNGAPGCGKTTFENLVKSFLDPLDVFVESTIDPVKNAAKILGWDGTKTPQNRKFLSNLKKLWIEWDDGVFKYMKHTLDKISRSYEIYDVNDDRAIVFIDSREPVEIERFKIAFNAKTILIKRPSGAEKEISNTSDRDVENFDYDIVIYNDGDLDLLLLKAKQFLMNEHIEYREYIKTQ